MVNPTIIGTTLTHKFKQQNSERNQITQPQPTNPSTVSLHHRRKEWHTAASVALKVRHPSVCLASLVIQVFNPCSLSPIAGASSSSASVVFVCSAALPSPFVCRSRSRLRSRSSPFTFARRSLFAFTRRSPFEFAFVFVWKPRCSASNTATNPRAPPSRRTSDFYYNKTVFRLNYGDGKKGLIATMAIITTLCSVRFRRKKSIQGISESNWHKSFDECNFSGSNPGSRVGRGVAGSASNVKLHSENKQEG
ncbi:hypothetical protein Ahy_A06g030697 [Arachis hypogaea]|uniref:Uncharacterized protein n=1 Tax=Arachis hypogaea TaxID=3818 RepID=A0A445CX41_ARAHY|nr:hypothetical protein Ahy_A06g030697 [Arachis hypogaea]